MKTWVYVDAFNLYYGALKVKVTGALPENVNYAVKGAYVLPWLDPYAGAVCER